MSALWVVVGIVIDLIAVGIAVASVQRSSRQVDRLIRPIAGAGWVETRDRVKAIACIAWALLVTLAGLICAHDAVCATRALYLTQITPDWGLCSKPYSPVRVELPSPGPLPSRG